MAKTPAAKKPAALERRISIEHDELVKMLRRVVADQVGIDLDDSQLAWSIELAAEHVPSASRPGPATAILTLSGRG